MSTNTTSTSDRIEADSLTSSPAQEEGAQRVSGSPLVATLPDPAVIARIANEFFATLPGASAPPGASVEAASPNGVDLRAPSGSAARTAVPDYPREMFSFPALPNSGSVPGLPQVPWTVPTGALTRVGDACFFLISISSKRREGRALGRCAADSTCRGDVFVSWCPGNSFVTADRSAEWVECGYSLVFTGARDSICPDRPYRVRTISDARQFWQRRQN
ncbi:MAG: hypothetical protein ABSG72_08965 [Candidatus Sulfotelmatobacter sp.]